MKKVQDIFKRKIKDRKNYKKIGPIDGESIRLSQQSASSVQDQIYNIVKKVAQSKKYAFVFDKASILNMLYSDSKFDITIDVFKELGIIIKKK
ncbi:MAG: OmpH family outer membrane protein [Flavobacteriales bacterium AspAUS03]